MTFDAENNEQPGPDQLDALLAEASALAEDLSLEIAGEDPFTGIEEVDHTAVDSADQDTPIPDVDTQLESVDELIAETQTALGVEAPAITDGDASASVDDIPDFMQEFTTPPQTEDESATSDEPSTDASVDAIPDFMQEFTRPEVNETTDEPSTSIDDIPVFDADSSTSESAQAVPQDSPSSVVTDTEAKPGRVGTSYDSAAAEHRNEPQPVASAQSIATRLPKWLPVHLLQRLPVAQVRDRVMALTMVIAEKGVDLLEVVDRPTRRLGFKPRQLIGLVAISTLGTALVVLLISMF